MYTITEYNNMENFEQNITFKIFENQQEEVKENDNDDNENKEIENDDNGNGEYEEEDSYYRLEISWKSLLSEYDFDIDDLYSGNIEVYPPRELLFEVFKEPCNQIKICILGQDPYHNPNEANGFAFSVPEDKKIPSSLKNIFKEINSEFPERNYNFTHGNLKKWSETGVFLLNCSLTVEKNKPGSHMELWEDFTNDVIKKISIDNDNVIFLLLGNFAKSKKKYIVNPKNNIIEAVHPSGLSANRGFFGSNVFIKIENALRCQFDWQN